MKRLSYICVCLFLCFVVCTATAGNAGQPNDGFAAFWQKFKTAVIAGDKKTIAALSKFPIEMSYGLRSIRTPADLNRRYRELFKEQADAAKCFAQKEPEKETGRGGAKLYSIACPDAAGNEVVVYEFQRTKTGWKLIGLDNINE
jgi:hypothetical protein